MVTVWLGLHTEKKKPHLVRLRQNKYLVRVRK